MLSHRSLALLCALVGLSIACPDAPIVEPDGGQIYLADAGPFLASPDAGFDDAGVPVVVDAGPINTAVIVTTVYAPSGPLGGLNRVTIEGAGFTGACNLDPPAGSGPCQVFFGDVEGDLIIGLDLPGKIRVRVPPGAAPGPVDVKVITALGVGLLEAGYTYFSPVTLDDVTPSTGTSEGGDATTIHGRGFSEEMIVTVGERQVVGLAVADDGASATFLTPPGAPGRADVVATDAFGQGLLALGFTYQSPLRLDNVNPRVVDSGDIVELSGSGLFDEPDSTLVARIGGALAVRDNLISEARLRVVIPAGVVGANDVSVTRGALSAVLEGAVVVRAPLTGAFVVAAAVPARLDVAGGSEVTLVGEGLTSAASVSVNGVLGTALAVIDDRTVRFIAPAGALGPAAIVLTRGDAASAATTSRYVQPLVIDAITPAAGPATGGTAVTLTGRGFASGVAPTVRFGGVPAVDVVVASDGFMTATTAAGAAGAVDVVIESVVDGDVERAVLGSGFRFDAPLSVLGVRPSRGAMGGNTVVTITGSGFSAGVPELTFDGVPAYETTVVNDSTIVARTPPRFTAGLVDVAVAVDSGAPAVAAQVFTYFNAAGNIVGGARGGPIEGAVYITAFDATFRQPIPGLVAYVGTGSAPAAAGITNVLGQATISGPDIHGPQTVTITGACFSAVTFVDVDAAELTAFLFSFCPPPPPPPSLPPPPPPPLPTLRGRVFGFAKEFFDPAAIDQSGCQAGPPQKCEIAFAEVRTTSRDEFGGTPQTGGANVVFEEGGEYFIAPSRTGRLAVVALAGIADLNNDTFLPRQLGVRREVNPARGDVLIDQDIELTIDLDAEIDLSLPDAPLRLDNANIGNLPTITRVIPFIQLGGEGAFVYTQAVAGRRNHTLAHMPKVPGEMLTFIAGAYTTDGRNMSTDAGTATLNEGDVMVTGSDSFLWQGANGQVFVTDRPDGSRFASVVESVVTPQDGAPVLLLNDAPDFSAIDATYHIGQPGTPSSEVMQTGNGDLRSGVTIQPVLGLPELLSPRKDGVLVDRTLRWKAASGQQPTIHDMLVYDPLAFASVWQLYVDGARTKVIIPRVPAYEDLLAVLPLDQRACVTALDPPDDLATYCASVYPGASELAPPPDALGIGAMVWQHEAVFAPDLDANNWSNLQIGARGRRAWTTDVHAFIHGQD